MARLLDHGARTFPDLQLSPGQSPDAWEPLLIGAAGLCVAGLTLRRSPWLAWFAVAVAASFGAIDGIAQVRGQLALVAAEGWPPLIGASAAVATIAAVVCAVLAWRASGDAGSELARAIVRIAAPLGLLAVAAFQVQALHAAIDPASAGSGADPIAPVRAANRILLAVLATDIVVAAMLVIWPRARRAWVRSRARAAGPATGDRPPSFVQALGDELVPGLRGRAERAATAERARLAADLHARVVPELRRAAGSSASGPTSLADVRGALADVETLMAERHSVVLEEFGLLAALEWLAERTEARDGTMVELDVGDEPEDGRPPREVEQAAFRIALLAIDNAVRHAPGAAIAVSIVAGPQEVRLAVEDDGPGIEAGTRDAARRTGHRGLVDIEAAAAAVGGRVSIGPDDGGSGTRVSFAWRTALA